MMNEQARRDVIRMYERGMPLALIVDRFGVGRRAVSRWLNDLGMPRMRNFDHSQCGHPLTPMERRRCRARMARKRF
jgi:DNA invertase Pin-like site-specific DNA recombinase